MGSCVSSNENSAKLNRKSNKGAELEDVQIELNMCEKRLADMANKVVVLHSKLKFTKQENDQLRAYVVSIKERYTENTIHLKRRLSRERESSEYYQCQFRMLQNKLGAKKRINTVLIQKYQALDKMYQYSQPRSGSVEIINASTISSKSFF